MEDRLMDDNTEDYLEILYWEFDADKKKFSFSERDLFKTKMRGLIRTIQNTRATDPPEDITGLAHELWALAQLMSEEGILDGVMRIEEALQGKIKGAKDPLMDKMAEEIEQLRVQLAGCGVAALSNTHKSREQQRVNPGDYGYSASYQDVFDAVGREMKYRELLERMAEALEEVVRCLSHGLQDTRASVTAEQALQEYRERENATK